MYFLKRGKQTYPENVGGRKISGAEKEIEKERREEEDRAALCRVKE